MLADCLVARFARKLALQLTSIAVAAACWAVPRPIDAQGTTTADALVGRWQAVVRSEIGALRSEDYFDFEFSRDALGLVFRDRGRYVPRSDASPVTISADGRIHTEWKQLMPFTLSLDASLAEGGQVLDATLRGLGVAGKGEIRVRLSHASSDAMRYSAPRLTSDGVRESRYAYTTPLALAGEWPVSTPEEVGMRRAPLEALVRDILAEGDSVSQRHTDAVLVLRHGRLVLEEYFWGSGRDLVHPIASITKSLAAILAGMAIDSGRLALDDLVIDRFPDYASRRWQRERYPIRVRDVLSMQGGVEWTDHSAADQYTQRFFAADDPFGFVMDLPAVESPGTRFNYNNGLAGLLGPLLTRAVGEPVATFARRRLFEPLGIRPYAWAALRDGTPFLAGGLQMPARDLAKLGQLVLAQGEWGGRSIVSRAWIARMTSQQTRADDYPYGYYWHLSDPARPWRGSPPSYLGPIDRFRAVMAVGQGGQALVILPEADVVIVISSSNWLPGMRDAFPTTLLNRYVIPAIR